MMLDAMRGGQIRWQVLFNGDDYSAYVTSISTISKSVNLQHDTLGPSATVTITLAGVSLDYPGPLLYSGVDIAIISDGQTLPLWEGTVTGDVTENNQQVLTVEGALSSTIDPARDPKALDMYDANGREIRNAFRRCLGTAYYGSATAWATLPYASTGYYQHKLMCSTPVSTLGGLHGVSTVGTAYLQCWTGTTDEGSVQKYTTKNIGSPKIFDFSWSTVQQEEDTGRILGGSLPLVWHKQGEIPFMMRYRSSAAHTGAMQYAWPVGRDRLTMACIYWGATSASTTSRSYIYCMGSECYPCDIKDGGGTVIHTTSEPVASASFDGIYPPATSNDETTTVKSTYYVYETGSNGKPKRKLKTGYPISRLANPTKTSWSAQAEATMGIYPTADPNETYSDTKTISCDLVGKTWASKSNPVQRRFVGDITITQPDCSSYLAGDIHAYSDFVSRYDIWQAYYPITQIQDNWTYDRWLQAGLLGAIAVTEGPAQGNLPGIEQVDLCPEAGTVFWLPLNSQTMTSKVEFVQYNKLPATVTATVRDPYGVDHTFNVELAGTDGDGDFAVDILQGSLAGSAENIGSTTQGQYSLDSNLWSGNPGFLYDRWNGVTNTSAGYIDPTVIAPSWQFGQYLVDDDGTEYPVQTNCQNLTSLSNYYTRDVQNVNRHMFATNGYVTMKNGTVLPQGKRLFFDAWAIKSLAMMYRRTFDDIRRPSYKVECCLAFAEAKPGTVVLLQHRSYDNGKPWLCFVQTVDIMPDSGKCNLTIIPMHAKADVTVGQFSNINAIVDHDQIQTAGVTSVPHIPL